MTGLVIHKSEGATYRQNVGATITGSGLSMAIAKAMQEKFSMGDGSKTCKYLI